MAKNKVKKMIIWVVLGVLIVIGGILVWSQVRIKYHDDPWPEIEKVETKKNDEIR